jgi:hypothetical protein
LNILHLKNDEIDKQKWDCCVDNCGFGLMYALSFYLDIMSPGWEALILNDYQFVMPLTCKRKFGISYLYQPAFTQQLGVFGAEVPDKNIVKSFLDKASESFRFAEINLNYKNNIDDFSKRKTNLILHLGVPFDEIKNKFRKDFVKNILKNHLDYSGDEDFATGIELFKNENSFKIRLSEKNYNRFSKLCYEIKKRGGLFVRKVYSSQGKLLSTAILFKDHRRIYYILSATNIEGRKTEANYFLLYHLIKEFSGHDLIFDFEGSDIPSIKFFFKKFGAFDEPYTFIKWNSLPYISKKIKGVIDRLQS